MDSNALTGVFDVFVRHGKRGYVGYYGPKGHLHSTRIQRRRQGDAKNDALRCLIIDNVDSLK